ncbi:MAG: serine hydrolase domain-containing protein [Candidatus Sumerlaeaceae bacterium]
MPRGNPAEYGLDGERLGAGMDRAFAAAIKDKQLSGGVALVLRRGHVVFEKAYGYRCIIGTTEPATLDTIYDVASLTKPVATASAIMKLVEQGRIRLRDGVKTYIPEWKNDKDADERTSEATRLKRYIRTGALRPSIDLLQSTKSLDGASLPNSPGELWHRMVSAGHVRLDETFIEQALRFDGIQREGVQLRHLLTHTSGLDPFDRYYLRWPERAARTRIIADIVQRKLVNPPGEAFIYSDLGFITLGEIVERVTSKTLAQFTHDEIFGPLGMRDTMFNPPGELLPRIAPTEWRESVTTITGTDDAPTTASVKTMIRGEVHDGNAYVQDGISGHAGLFSTARDLAIFCQMLLKGGEHADVRIFSPLTVIAMSTDQAQLKTDDQRGYGWDIKTSYSGPRGDIFTTGFGHTGWTGTSIWIVPEEQIAIIILTNRVHPDGTGDATPLRSKIANVVAGSILKEKNLPQ